MATCSSRTTLVISDALGHGTTARELQPRVPVPATPSVEDLHRVVVRTRRPGHLPVDQPTRTFLQCPVQPQSSSEPKEAQASRWRPRASGTPMIGWLTVGPATT